jgi:outer membrane protein
MRRPSAYRTLASLPTALVLAILQQPAVSGQSGFSLQDVVTQALTSHPSLRLAAADTQAALADRSAAREPFAMRLRAFVEDRGEHTPLSADGTRAGLRYLQQTFGGGLVVERTFRSGLTFSSEASFTRAGVAPFESAHDDTAAARWGLAVPLMAGRAGGFNASVERAAEEYVASTRAAQQHSTAAVAYGVIAAYWQFLAADHRRDVYLASEQRAEQLVEETRLLIRADERPPSDLDLILAHLASKRAARLLAELRVQQGRHELGLAAGASAEAVLSWGPPTTGFPDVTQTDLHPSMAAAAAVDGRDDLRAARSRETAAQIVRDGARSELKGRLDLHLTATYDGQLHETVAAESQRPFHGLGASWQLVYQPMVGLPEARSRAMRSAAEHARAETLTADVQRRVRSDAALAATAVTTYSEELKAVREAVRRSDAAVQTEQKKFHAGLATIFDAILAADTLTSALVAEIDARTKLAIARARLRFETGALLVFDGLQPRVDFASIL